MEKFYKRPTSFDMNVSLKSYKKTDFNDNKPIHNIQPLTKEVSDLITDKLKNNPIKSNTTHTHIKDLRNYGSYDKTKNNTDNDHIKFLKNSYFGFNKPSKINYEPDNIIKNNIFGDPTDEQKRINNLQTEAGLPNPLNDRIISFETGASLPDLKQIDQNIGSERNKEINKIMDTLKNDIERVNTSGKTNNTLKKKLTDSLNNYAENEINDLKNEFKYKRAQIKPVLLAKKEEDPEEFKEENPMNNEEEEKRKKDIERKKVNEKRQQEINNLVNPIKRENENLKKFTELKQKIQNLNISKLETKDPLRKEVNVLLKQYNKNIGKSQLKGSVLKTLNQIEPEIKLISEQRIEEAEMKNKSIESEKKEPRKPRKSTVHKLATIEDEPNKKPLRTVTI